MHLIFTFILYAVGFLLASSYIVHAQETRPKPNFIILFVDDLGETDVGSYGNEFIETPNIDRLAAQGMSWTHAYSAAPICSPSRAALLTGKNPARIHFTGHITAIGRHRHPENSRIIPPNDLMFIPKDEVLLPEAIAPAGYKSISIGKWHVGPQGYWPTDMGFDENVAGWTHGSPPTHFFPYENPDKHWNPAIPTLKGGKEGEYLADRLTDEAIEYIHQNPVDPFLIYLPYYAVHTPLQAPEELIDKYERKQHTIDSNDKIDPIYAAMVDNLDQNVGRLMRTLDELELRKNTVVIFTSDNGAVKSTSDMGVYRDGKGFLYEGGIRVPLIIRWPGVIEPGTWSSYPAKTEDIYATIIDIAETETNSIADIDGRSLRNHFSRSYHETNETERELYWYYPHYAPQGNNPGASIIQGKYKYLQFYDPVTSELYDLHSDPSERNNLVDDRPELVIELRGKLNKWLHDVDPIRHTINPEYTQK